MHEPYSKLPKAGLKNVLKQYKWFKGDGNEGHETIDCLPKGSENVRSTQTRGFPEVLYL